MHFIKVLQSTFEAVYSAETAGALPDSHRKMLLEAGIHAANACATHAWGDVARAAEIAAALVMAQNAAKAGEDIQRLNAAVQLSALTKPNAAPIPKEPANVEGGVPEAAALDAKP